MAKVYLPMTSPEAYEFFASNHKCNHAKAVMAHSATMQQANDTFWRRGFTLQMRKRFLKTYKKYLGQQDMSTIPMSPEVNPDTGEMYEFWMDELERADDISLDDLLK